MAGRVLTHTTKVPPGFPEPGIYTNRAGKERSLLGYAYVTRSNCWLLRWREVGGSDSVFEGSIAEWDRWMLREAA